MYGAAVTKKNIIDWMIYNIHPTSIVKVDTFETSSTRHICNGSKVIQILPKSVCSIPTEVGVVNVEIVYCNTCGKLIVNKESLDIM